jgi:SAM-dependent methyltransferase
MTAQPPWSSQLDWLSEEAFRTRRFSFSGSVKQYDGETDDNKVAILKHRQFIDIYRELLPDGADLIFEIGFFQGGMPLFLADMIAPKKIVGIDYNAPSDKLSNLIARNNLSDTIKLYGGVLQNDVAKISGILKSEFNGEPLDLIIDDCSHEYENTKVCFENFFSYLKPGGRYVIEDWGWLHWPGEPWQTKKSHFHGKAGMTNIIFEAVMSLGTDPKIISRVDVVSEFCVVITRGPKLGHGERLNLEKSYLTAGRRFVPISYKKWLM